MKWFENLKVSTKLFGSFAVVLVLTSVLALIAVQRFGDLSQTASEITENWMPSIAQLQRMDAHVSELRIAQLRTVFADSPEELDRYIKMSNDFVEDIVKAQADYAPLVGEGAEREAWTRYLADWQKYATMSARTLELVRQKKPAEARALLIGDGRQLFDELGTAMDTNVKINSAGAAAATKAAADNYASGRVLILSLLVLAVALGVVTAFVASRAISQPLVNVIDVFKNMSAGKLDNAIDSSRKDELGTVLARLSELQGQLRKLIAENQGQLEAIGKVQAVIEFQPDGTILSANENFLNALGYTLDEIKGRHHSMFIPPAERNSQEYERFWAKLRRGEYDKNRYLRIAKDGHDVWIDASYNPIVDDTGKPYKVVKYASDVTAQVLQTRAMENAVAQTQDAIRLATEGDLTSRVQANDKTGDLRKMAESINSLLGSMAEIVSKVQGAASEVSRGADEISQGNANLSQRTEEQSSSLEETASSMEQMTSTVKQNADNAGQANQLASAARDQAEKGGQVTSKAVRAMTEINESSKKIADIIGVIDEIAFQTNLLALNAAVEAARAGEQGRGFAVVATEVRSLAGRSATAAKEIKELIQDSVKKVEDGSVLVTQSGQTLELIVSSVKKVSDIIAEIAAAGREQSAGIEQVNKAIMQMDEMTQQNAALVEEASAASQSMAEQARSLNEMMSRYRLGEGSSSVSSGASSRPAAGSNVAPLRASERRSTARPWSAKGGAARPAAKAEPAEAAAPAPERKAAASGGGSDSEWQEF